MTDELRDALIVLLVQQLDGERDAAAIVDWATEVLGTDVDTPSLAILAGLPRNGSIFDVEPWFARVLGELEVAPPSADELRRSYVGVISRRLLAGAVLPEQALELVHSHAVSPLNHPDDLAAWCFVWEGLDPTDYRPLDAEGAAREARALAATWARRPTTI